MSWSGIRLPSTKNRASISDKSRTGRHLMWMDWQPASALRRIAAAFSLQRNWLPWLFLERIEAGLIQHGGVGVRSDRGTRHPGRRAALALGPDTPQPLMPYQGGDKKPEANAKPLARTGDQG